MPCAVRVRRLARACRLAVAVGALAGVVASSAPDLHAQPTRDGQPHEALAAVERALSSGDPDHALELGTAYLKRYPRSPRAHVLMARARLAKGALGDAYEELRHALDADPRDVDALYYLGLVSARLSEAEFRRLAGMNPNSPRLHQLMAESLDAQGQRPAAAREYQAALDGDPTLVPALLGLAKLKRIALECEDAIRLYTRAEALQSTFDGAYGLGVCESVQQDDEAAVRRFEEAIARDPRAAVAWVGLGTALNKLRRPADAIPKLRHAIELEPAMGEAYYALGAAYRANHQPERAAEAFRKAEQLGGAIGGGPSVAPSEAPH